MTERIPPGPGYDISHPLPDKAYVPGVPSSGVDLASLRAMPGSQPGALRLYANKVEDFAALKDPKVLCVALRSPVSGSLTASVAALEQNAQVLRPRMGVNFRYRDIAHFGVADTV